MNLNIETSDDNNQFKFEYQPSMACPVNTWANVDNQCVGSCTPLTSSFVVSTNNQLQDYAQQFTPLFGANDRDEPNLTAKSVMSQWRPPFFGKTTAEKQKM